MNPNTYDWYQCDEEDYDSSASLEEQRETARLKAEREEEERQIARGQRPAAPGEKRKMQLKWDICEHGICSLCPHCSPWS